MTELTGGLIQMNSHMVVTNLANFLIVGGAFIVGVFIIGTILLLMDRPINWKYVAIVASIAAIGGVIVLYGANMPRIKEIHACADGQVSIEQIGVRYDIVKIDGKELTLRER